MSLKNPVLSLLGEVSGATEHISKHPTAGCTEVMMGVARGGTDLKLSTRAGSETLFFSLLLSYSLSLLSQHGFELALGKGATIAAIVLTQQISKIIWS